MTEEGDSALSPNPPSAHRPTTAGVAPNPHAVGIVLGFEQKRLKVVIAPDLALSSKGDL